MNSSKAILFLLLVSSLVLFNACDTVKGTRNSNINPQIDITSYQGSDLEDLVLDGDGNISVSESFIDTLIFQQSIFWHGYDQDGIIEGYAFRISKMNDQGVFEVISIPQYEAIDTNGWVYHYKEGVQITSAQSLGDNDYSTIWSNLKSTTINFPANIVLDKVANQDSIYSTDIKPFKFEIKCVDDREGESNIAEKYFFTKTWRPTVFISSAKGDLDAMIDEDEITLKRTGTGLQVEFTMTDSDPYITSEAYYYEYWLDKVDLDGNVIGEPSEKYSTFGNSDVNAVLLKDVYDSEVNKPNLVPDTYDAEADTFLTNTRIIAQAIDYAGAVSITDTVIFNVADFFNPNAVIYVNRVFCIGALHYAPSIDQAINFIIPDAQTQSGIHYSTPFYIDQDTLYTALWSSDFRIYMKWGWNGEYEGNVKSGKYLGKVFDETTGSKYFCDIEYFDLQLDGNAYVYPELSSDPSNIITDEDGSTWLRVPRKHDIGQETVLTNLAAGVHTFTVRAVDLQNKHDINPTTFEFKLMDPHFGDKEGILILDDDEHNQIYCPDDILDTLYSAGPEGLLSFYNGTIDVLDRQQLKNSVWNSELHFGKAVFAPSDLVSYKTIIYHADNPQDYTKLNILAEQEVLAAYLETGGNLIISSGAALDQLHSVFSGMELPCFPQFFGISNEDEAVNALSLSYQQNTYFTGATSALAGYPEVTLNIESDSTFNPLLNIYKGLGPVAYFTDENIDEGSEVLYRLSCKPTDAAAFPPTQEEFDMYNGKPVAVKKISPNNKMYLFGFPLSYMNPAEVSTMLESIVTEIESN